MANIPERPRGLSMAVGERCCFCRSRQGRASHHRKAAAPELVLL